MDSTAVDAFSSPFANTNSSSLTALNIARDTLTATTVQQTMVFFAGLPAAALKAVDIYIPCRAGYQINSTGSCQPCAVSPLVCCTLLHVLIMSS